MKQTLKRLPHIVAALLLVGVLILGLVGAFTGLRVVPVLTGSMHPEYGAGSLVFTRPVATGSLRVGQVIAFRPPPPFTTPRSAPIMHRIIEVEHQGSKAMVQTRGDSNPTADAWTLSLEEAETYRAFGVVPYVGRVPMAIQSTDRSVSTITVIGIGLLGLAVFLWPSARRGNRDAWNVQSESFNLANSWPLVASAPHELRSALAQVRGSVELAMDMAESAKQRELLSIANRSTERLSATIEKLLFASGLESWNSDAEIGMSEVILHAIAEIDLDKEQVSLGATSEKARVEGNSFALTRAVQSMVDHVQFMTGAENVVAIEVGGSRSEVKVQVSAPESLEVGHRSSTWPVESSLNLALVQRVAVDHGGSLTHGSSDGEVSVELSLPKARNTYRRRILDRLTPSGQA